jgi:hypothetical protein
MSPSGMSCCQICTMYKDEKYCEIANQRLSQSFRESILSCLLKSLSYVLSRVTLVGVLDSRLDSLTTLTHNA